MGRLMFSFHSVWLLVYTRNHLISQMKGQAQNRSTSFETRVKSSDFFSEQEGLTGTLLRHVGKDVGSANNHL